MLRLLQRRGTRLRTPGLATPIRSPTMTQSSAGSFFALSALLAVATSAQAQQRPWVTAEARLERDDQVRTALRATAEHGRYLGPDITLALTVSSDHVAGDANGATSLETTVASVGLAGTLAVPTARLGLTFAAGTLLGAPAGPQGGGTEWLARATLRRDLGGGTALRMGAARERYTATLASLDTLVLSHTMEVALDRSGAPGWAWEVAGRRAGFGDDNPVTTAWVWVLAPLSRSMTHSLRAGYAFGWQDAEQSTWVASGVVPAGPFPQQVPGRYAPYYSPHDVVTHSVVLNGALAAGSGWILAEGSVGARATETAPLLVRASAAAVPGLTFRERSFTPYRARVSLVAPADDRTTITLAVGYDRTAYYRAGTVRLAVARSL